MTLTWHQKRGEERSNGFHRFVAKDEWKMCLHCGMSITENADEHNVYPLNCGPNDARLKGQLRDEDFAPHTFDYHEGDTHPECIWCGVANNNRSCN